MKMITHHEIVNLVHTTSSAESDGKLYALVDHGGMPGLVKQLDRASVTWISLFSGSRDEGALKVAPLLILMDFNHGQAQLEKLSRWICEHGAFSSSVLFLASPLRMEDLSRRLATRLDATLPDNMDVVLRYFDARVFEQLMLVLSTEQKRAFLNVANRWWFINRRGELEVVDAAFSGTNTSEIPLSLSAYQEGALIDASEPDQVAAILQPAVPVQYASLAPELRYDFIVRQIVAARLLGIRATHELALYCSMALLHGEEFAEQDPWAASLDKIKKGMRSLTQALEEMEFRDIS